jgi:hypothetical protein
MARFRLTDKHYINILGCDWEEKQELQTKVRGRNRLHKRSHAVPMYLDPKDMADHNYPGEIVIATEEDRRYPDDYIVGPGFIVTADMSAIDDEGEEMITEWKRTYTGAYPIETLEGTMGDTILAKLSRQLDALSGGNPTGPSTVSAGEVAKLRSENEDIKAQLAAMMERLNAMTNAKPSVERRV